MNSYTNTSTRSSIRTAALGVALALSTFACAGHGGGGMPPISAFDDGVAHTGSVRSRLHFTEMIDQGLSRGTSLRDALVRLRPEYLRPRLTTGGGRLRRTPEVYLESVHLGGLEALQWIPVGHVESVQFMRPSEALIRYGILRNHQGGVILVTLRQP